MPTEPDSSAQTPSADPSIDGKELNGQIVLTTRAIEQSGALCRALELRGAQTLVHPVIKIMPLDDFSEIDRIVGNLQSYQTIVFVSTNGVNHFLNRVPDFRSLNSTKILAIGKATSAQVTATLGSKVEALVPESSNSESLAKLIIEQANQRSTRILIVRADRGSNVLRDRLENHNKQSDQIIDFDEVVAYRSTDVDSTNKAIETELVEGRVNWITLTSSAIAKSALKLFGQSIKTANSREANKCKLVSISPTTTQAIRDCGFEPDAEAATFDVDGIVEAIAQN